ncbi:hypothetical protein [Phyllobacterium leguminum]|uniref:Uncharacterized protein n=1 Tax=Phyllobacterium leguminum TaxID=314237 RepID=A0A318SZI3_9HYPH|nr:hypothetical protein [Phyllobacterium leguminum]PYE87536.1 hypothetical protein C7477_11237 [Phyllobacterium leguminum]
MSAFLSKLTSVSDRGSLLDALSFWAVIAFVLGVMFYAEIAAIAVMVARAG